MSNCASRLTTSTRVCADRSLQRGTTGCPSNSTNCLIHLASGIAAIRTSRTGMAGWQRLYHCCPQGGTLLHERLLEKAQRLAINMRNSLEPHLRALCCVEHPLRNFDQHRMRGRFGKLAQVRSLRMRAASLARRNGEPKPTVPRIKDFPRIKSDFVGFLSWVCSSLARHN